MKTLKPTQLSLPLAAIIAIAAGCGGRTGALDEEGDRSAADGGDPKSSDDGSIASAIPQAVITGIESPCNVLVHGGRLYWTGRYHLDVWGCDLEDCAKTRIRYAEEQGGWTVMAADEARIYWGYNLVASCPIAGCTGEPIGCQSGSVTRLALDGSRLFWSSKGSWALNACTTPECACPGNPLAPGQSDAETLELHGDDVYWIHPGASGAVMRTPKSGGDSIELAGLQNQPLGLHVDDEFVYWTTRWAGGSVFRCAKTGCDGAPTTLLGNQQNPGMLLGDGAGLYWIASPVPGPNDTGASREEIHTCAKGACFETHRTPVAGAALPVPGPDVFACRQRIAQDDSYLYWADDPSAGKGPAANGSIMRIHK